MLKVVKRETARIYGLDDTQTEQIKKSLTVMNPKYVSAQRFSKWKVTRIPKYLTFYEQHLDYLEVPVGYEIPFKAAIKDNRATNDVSYPQIKIQLRDNQVDAYRSWIKDTDSGIICMATGKGKTILGIYCAYATRQKTLIIVHKNDLFTGWQDDCKVCFGEDFKCGEYGGGKKSVGEQITVATIQTLNSWANKDLKSFNEFTKQFGMIIVDEMHHIAGSIYELINHFPAYYKIGLTATPERSDGLTAVMYWYLKDMAYKYEYTREDEDILPARAFVLSSGVSFMPMAYQIPLTYKDSHTANFRYLLEQDVKSPQDCWDKIPLEDIPIKKRPRINYVDVDDTAVSSDKTMELVGNKLFECYKNGNNILLFFSQKFHCQMYYDYVKQHYNIPESAMCVYNGDFSRDELTEMRKQIEAGNIRVTFATYSIATEGTNVKAWDTAFLVSSINNGKNVEQAVGRIRRTKSGKPPVATIYDIRYPNVYSLKNHRWVKDRRYKDLKIPVVDESRLFTGIKKRSTTNSDY